MGNAGLDAIENGCLGGSLQLDAFGRNVQFIAFRVGYCGIERQGDCLLGCLGRYLHLCTGHLPDVGGQELGRASQLFVAGRIADGGSRMEYKGGCTRHLSHLLWSRDHVEVAHLLRAVAGVEHQ